MAYYNVTDSLTPRCAPRWTRFLVRKGMRWQGIAGLPRCVYYCRQHVWNTGDTEGIRVELRHVPRCRVGAEAGPQGAAGAAGGHYIGARGERRPRDRGAPRDPAGPHYALRGDRGDSLRERQGAPPGAREPGADGQSGWPSFSWLRRGGGGGRPRGGVFD